MEKSKPSEEEIIKLGKKIVEELSLEPSVNTLGRWMSHYVADLILQSENCKSKLEKEKKQKECCEIILNLWKDREHLPNVSTPLSELAPLIEMLKVLKTKDSTFPFWMMFKDIPSNPTWKGFMEVVKNNSENIFELCLFSSVNSDLLEKKKEWLKEHYSMLAKEEKELLEHLEYLVNQKKYSISFSDEKEETINFDKLTSYKRYEAIFNKIESGIEEQKERLLKLKKSILANFEE